MEKETERMNRVYQGQSRKKKEHKEHKVTWWSYEGEGAVYWLSDKKEFTWIVSEPQDV